MSDCMSDRKMKNRGALLALSLSIALTGPAPAAGTFAVPLASDPAPPPSAGQTAQTIRIRPLPAPTYLDPDFDIDATATSALPVHFTASGDCAVKGTTVHLLSAGKCSITASQPGDTRYQAAPDVEIRLAIGKAEQTIRLPKPSFKAFLDPDFDLGATANSGLPVVLVATGDCEVNGSIARILGAGTCSVSALQPGDSSFTAARIVDVTFAIARADQTIDFRFSGPLYRNTDFRLTASATSSLPVRFDAYGTCWVSGSVLHLLADGICTVTADQAGSKNFNPAPTVTKTVTVLPIQ
jgi:hypothetical protein